MIDVEMRDEIMAPAVFCLVREARATQMRDDYPDLVYWVSVRGVVRLALICATSEYPTHPRREPTNVVIPSLAEALHVAILGKQPRSAGLRGPF